MFLHHNQINFDSNLNLLSRYIPVNQLIIDNFILYYFANLNSINLLIKTGFQ